MISSTCASIEDDAEHRSPTAATVRAGGLAHNRPSTVDFWRKVVCVMGLPFDMIEMDEAVRRVRTSAAERSPLMVSTANLNFVVTARTDEAFRESIIHSQLSLADGMPIVWVARMLGLPIRQRVTGSGLFEAISQAAAAPAVKVFFFGGPAGVAQAASERVNRHGDGGVTCVGFVFPGFVAVEDMSGDDLIERINVADPDFVVVSLGAKKGQAWIERNRSSLTAPVICHLGAVVNFAAGTVRRAPGWMQRVGLEWAWRIIEEPSLWKRYAADGLVLLRVAAASVLPLWWQEICARFAPSATAASVDVVPNETCFQLKLRGSFDRHSAELLREPFSNGARQFTRIRIDLSDVVRIDPTAMGLFLLLHGHQRDINRPLELHGASSALERQFHHHGTEFLLAGPVKRHMSMPIAEAQRSRA